MAADLPQDKQSSVTHGLQQELVFIDCEWVPPPPGTKAQRRPAGRERPQPEQESSTAADAEKWARLRAEAEEAQKRAQHLADRLRQLGIDPDVD